jgi:precorrin-6Y C5,15-methyltransferase (decarboxylating)
VATDYGEEVLKEEPCALAKVHKGRMTAEEMAAFLKEGGFTVVVDATHPYAQIVTENIKAAANASGVRYLRLLREMGSSAGGAEACANAAASGQSAFAAGASLGNGPEMPEMRYFPTTADCAEGLRETEGNILLTTGSKELSVFAETEGLRDRLIARVLPGAESIALCG